MLYYELVFYTSDFVQNYKISDDWLNVLSEFSETDKLLIKYDNLAAFTCLMLFLRMIQYFRFNRQLSILSDIITSSALDIGFFVTMFLVIIFAYSLTGYMLLGYYHTGYRTVGESLLTCYLMLLNYFDLKTIQKADNVIGDFFFASFMIMFKFVLLNMIIAIIYAHYTTQRPKMKIKDLGFFPKMIQVIKLKLKKQKYIISPEPKESNSEHSDENGFNLSIGDLVADEGFIIENKAPSECSQSY